MTDIKPQVKILVYATDSEGREWKLEVDDDPKELKRARKIAPKGLRPKLKWRRIERAR